MERTFENALVETDKFISLFLTSTFKIVFAMTLIGLVIVLIFRKSTSEGVQKMIFIHTPESILLIFKFILSLTIVRYAFYYDFTLKIFHDTIAEKMTMSTLFVGILAVYEVFTCIFTVIKIFWDVSHGK